MAVIKPVQFPQIQRTPVQNNPKPVSAKHINPADRQSTARPENLSLKPNVKPASVEGIKSSRDEKLEIAIEVLRQKTAQFYGPKKNEVKQTAALGAFIDIKA